MMKFIKKNIWEIERSSSLVLYGILFALLNMTLFFFWRSSAGIVSTPESQPLLCWPFFESCQVIRLIPTALISPLFALIIFTNLLAIAFFAVRRGLVVAWFLLFFSTLVQLLIYAQDASLQSNFLSLFFLISLSYLLIPNKSNLIRLLIFLSYILSAFYKLEPEWLSGVTLPQRLAIPLKGYEWIAVFSVLIEMVMPWLLISRERIRMAYGFLALFLYQGFHFYFWRQFDQIGAAALLIFVLFEHFEQNKKERESFYRSYEHPEPSKFWWPVILGSFALAQTNWSAQSSLQIFKIEKANTYSDCQQFSFVQFENKIEQVDTQFDNDLSPRLKCHPTVAFNKTKSMCEKNKNESGFKNITTFFLTRGLADTDYKLLFSSNRFCDSNVTLKASQEAL